MSGITQNDIRYAPRQAEIVSDLLERIHSNKLPPGAELPSVVNLSRQYSASTATIQRVITQLRERGYVRTMSRGSVVADNPPHLSNFGMVLPCYDYESQYIYALEREARHLSGTTSADGIERRFSCFHDVNHPEEKIRRHSKLMMALEERSVGGLIFITGTAFLRDILLHRSNVPCVTLFTGRIAGVCNIAHSQVIRPALDILKKSGRKRVALLTAARYSYDVVDPFMQMVEERAMITHQRWIHGIQPSGMSWAESCALSLMNDTEKPDAIIIGDDNLVPYAAAGIAASGVNVPGDLMVVAHANFPHVTKSKVPAIRIGTDVRRLMKIAVETIEAKRRGENVPDEILLQPCLENEASS